MRKKVQNTGSLHLKELFLYGVVGGIATVVEWLAFWLVTNLIGVHYIWATCLAFAVSTFANWLFGRLLVFKISQGSLAKEILSVYATSVVGLLLNLLIMFILVESFTVNQMPAKVAATALVFIYNYLIRKYFIYKTKDDPMPQEDARE